ncbi:MAG: DUF4349 domain-containing protein [Desulfovibrio sp.]|jgi:hypothetical protein|nr:DUF4349 domain-containing protein [Desulfovibrio sp.]
MTDIPVWVWDHVPTILQWLSTALVAWIWWSLKRTFVTREDCGKSRVDTEGAMRKQGHDIERLLEDVEQAPDAADLLAIKLSLERLNGRLDAMQEQLRGQAEVLKIVKHQVDRVNTYLLEHGVK